LLRFATDNPATISTLQPQNMINKENQVENNSGKMYEILLEVNIATEVDPIALDYVGLLSIHFKVIIYLFGDIMCT